MRYQVDLEELLSFVDRLQAFEQRAEMIASSVDQQVIALHENWAGDGVSAHKAQHDKWMAGAAEMREAISQLRAAADNAHQNYTDAAGLNVEMLS